MHIHILGICGTFMGSLACLAVEKGLRVTGCDQGVYPPMSDQLQALGVDLIEGYGVDQMSLKPDLWVIGNAMSRGNPLVEAVLDSGQPYVSGPAFLQQQILPGKWVMAVAGTHGKTSTASMLAWVLEKAGFDPGFLIGGVPANFSCSARLGTSDFFVIEADEYDTAFFDKRSKFVHYLPRTLILNNLEFDHADIFDDLAAIQRQFHHLLRIVPGIGSLIVNGEDANLEAVLQQGFWSEVQRFGVHDGDAENKNAYDWILDDNRHIHFQGEDQGRLDWSLLGRHNRMNALAVVAAARSIGILPSVALEALAEFGGVKRRMELIADNGICRLYDDFAHHPTAIETTLAGLRAEVKNERIVAIIEPRSYTMRSGVHEKVLVEAANQADVVYWFQPPDTDWDLAAMIGERKGHRLEADFDELLESLVLEAQRGGHLLIMSNGGFNGLHRKLAARIQPA